MTAGLHRLNTLVKLRNAGTEKIRLLLTGPGFIRDYYQPGVETSGHHLPPCAFSVDKRPDTAVRIRISICVFGVCNRGTSAVVIIGLREAPIVTDYRGNPMSRGVLFSFGLGSDETAWDAGSPTSVTRNSGWHRRVSSEARRLSKFE